MAGARSRRRFLAGGLAAAIAAAARPGRAADPPEWLASGSFAWRATGPLIAPASGRDDPCHAIKDPTVVRFGDRWHVFCTIRSRRRTHQIEYLSLADWSQAHRAERTVLRLTDGYFCAPQVFYFRPQRKWYLIYQVNEPSRKPSLQPAWSTSDDLARPDGWTPPKLLFAEQPANVERWIDFWVICDQRRAHLFFTSNDGRMWRSETRLDDFPAGWSRPAVVLEADLFEASHTYRLAGMETYLTLVEAQAGQRRYYQAYLADRLDGAWRPLAATLDRPFASVQNVRDQGTHWTDSFSHGELLRAGHDERLEVDPRRLRFLYQGVSDAELRGKPYGEIPWRLGLLE